MYKFISEKTFRYTLYYIVYRKQKWIYLSFNLIIVNFKMQNIHKKKIKINYALSIILYLLYEITIYKISINYILWMLIFLCTLYIGRYISSIFLINIFYLPWFKYFFGAFFFFYVKLVFLFVHFFDQTFYFVFL